LHTIFSAKTGPNQLQFGSRRGGSEWCCTLHPLDLLLLDVNMDGMNGPQALREIRREFPTAFVIMLTASGDLETVRDCIGHGAAGYILKDTSLANILVRVGNALGLGN
jgi:Response regulator containing a CheY-like receiver domain and an HTH DNA-binding domain